MKKIVIERIAIEKRKHRHRNRKKKKKFARSTIEKNEIQMNIISLFDIYINLKNSKF